MFNFYTFSENIKSQMNVVNTLTSGHISLLRPQKRLVQSSPYEGSGVNFLKQAKNKH